MANDPFIPDDIKRLARNGVRNVIPGVAGVDAGQSTGLHYGPAPVNLDLPARWGGASSTDTGVRAGVVPSADAINAGPPAAGVIDATKLAPPSPLDAEQPLPSGVRRYQSSTYFGTPGTNDVIYEGRGAHGERAFSNNQFAPELRGTTTRADQSVNPGLVALAQRRRNEIDAYTGAQRQAASAAANASAIAPKTADEYNDRLKVLNDIRNTNAATADKHVADVLSAQGKAGENISNDPLTQISRGVREAAIKSGAAPEAAVERGYQAAALNALNSGLDPNDPTLPPDARSGVASVRRSLASIINNNATTGFAGGFGDRRALVTDPDRLDLGSLELGVTPLTHYPTLTGPADEKGNRRQVVLSNEQMQQFAPYVQSARAAGLARRSKGLISDRK
jgi:hypothetical protein